MLEESIWASMNSWLTPTVLFLFLNLMIGTIYVTSSLATHKHSDHHHEADNHHHRQLPRSPSVLQRLKSVNFYTYRSPEPTTVTYEKNPLFDTHFPVQQSPPEIYHQNQPFLSRSPSVLQRLKSINLYNYFSQESIAPNQEPQTPSHLAPHNALHQNQNQERKEDVFDEEEEEEETIDEIYSKLQSNNKVSRSKSDTEPSCGEMPKKLPKKMRKSASTKSAFGNFEAEEEERVEIRRPATVKEGKSKMAEVDDADAEVDAKADDFINKFKQQLKLQRIDSIMRYKDMIHRGSSKN